MKIQHRGNYQVRRQVEYPPVAEQLDALWHGMDTGALPKVEPFYSDLLAVKRKYPDLSGDPQQQLARDKTRLKLAVGQELQARIQAPIQVGDILLDGDEKAQGNLQSKLTEMKARLDLGLPTPVEMLVWRDHHNVTHSWETLTEYYTWLAGYAVLLSTRGTLLYRQSWLHKEAIETLDSLEAARAYDVTQGWLP